MTAELEAIITTERLGKYLTEAGFDRTRALALYGWNKELSAAFLPLLSAAEICLRNRVVSRLRTDFGLEWWRAASLITLLGDRGKGIVKRAERSIRDSGRDVDSGRMTAELNFGFWEKMLLPKYQTALWLPIDESFPDLPVGVDQLQLHVRCQGVVKLRNRISHHEPILLRDISKDYSDCLEFVGWLSRAKALWIQPRCNVMAVMRKKP